MTASYYLQAIFTISLLGGVFYIVIKLSSAYRKKRFSGEIEIVDRLGIDAGATIAIIKIRGQDYLFSVAGKDVKLLKEL
jgi:flagellar biogenesis protein FliO